MFFFFFSSRRRHTRLQGDWSSDVCSSDLPGRADRPGAPEDDPARHPGGPGPPRAADPSRLHRQEPADVPPRGGRGAAHRARRRGPRRDRRARGGLSMGWTRKDLLTIRELEAAEILTLVDTAASLQEIATREIKKVPALRGKTVVNLFYENSTRTRTSFEIAGKWLSAD